MIKLSEMGLKYEPASEPLHFCKVVVLKQVRKHSLRLRGEVLNLRLQKFGSPAAEARPYHLTGLITLWDFGAGIGSFSSIGIGNCHEDGMRLHKCAAVPRRARM